MKKYERDPTVGSLDTDLLSLYSNPIGGMTPTVYRRRVVLIPRNSMENRLQKHVKTFECDPTVGSLDTDSLSWYSSLVGRKAPTERRWRVVRSPQNSMENSLRKHAKKFECDPTVGSLHTDRLSRYSRPFGGKAPTGHCLRVVPIPRFKTMMWASIKQISIPIPTLVKCFTWFF